MTVSSLSDGLSSAKITPSADFAAELAANPEDAHVMPGTLNFTLCSAAETYCSGKHKKIMPTSTPNMTAVFFVTPASLFFYREDY